VPHGGGGASAGEVARLTAALKAAAARYHVLEMVGASTSCLPSFRQTFETTAATVCTRRKYPVASTYLCILRLGARTLACVCGTHPSFPKDNAFGCAHVSGLHALSLLRLAHPASHRSSMRSARRTSAAVPSASSGSSRSTSPPRWMREGGGEDGQGG